MQSMFTDSGDTAWVMSATALTFIMSLPGVVLLNAGLSGVKNVLDTALQSVAITSLVCLCWLTFGYSLAFGDGCRGVPCVENNAFIGGSEKFWLWGPATHTLDNLSKSINMLPMAQKGSIPESIFIVFQCAFATITALVTAFPFVVGRVKLHVVLVFIFFWHFFVYCVVAHWTWAEGYLAQWGVVDFAGGYVVHIVAGVSGLVISSFIGPFSPDTAVRSTQEQLLVLVGGCLLWVGSFGFTAGSAYSARKSATMIVLVTHIAASTSSFTWILMECVHRKKPSLVGAVCGAVTGLVVVSPGCGYIDQTGAFVMGIAGAVSCYGVLALKNRLGCDHNIIHAVGGIVGCVLTGLFANPDIHNRRTGASSAAGAFYLNADQLGWQIVGVMLCALWSAVITLVLMLVLKYTVGLNAVEEPEAEETVTENMQPVMVCAPMPVEYVHSIPMSVMQPVPYAYQHMPMRFGM